MQDVRTAFLYLETKEKLMKKAFIFSLLFAGLSASATAQNQTGASFDAAANKKLAAECQQLFKDTNTLANGFCRSH